MKSYDIVNGLDSNIFDSSHFFLHLFSGPDFYFKYPNGDELYSVVALYLAKGIHGEMKITDGESNELRFFGRDEMPTLENRAKKIIEWLFRENLI